MVNMWHHCGPSVNFFVCLVPFVVSYLSTDLLEHVVLAFQASFIDILSVSEADQMLHLYCPGFK